VDFDGDGVLDLVSGSYDPGEVYLFRGRGAGKFAAREAIVDKSGKPIIKVPDQKNKIESFGSWTALVDWDDDGDLDIIVGTFDGLMFLRRNDGSRANPAYATDNEWLVVGAQRLRVPSGEHAAPVIADWDDDGLWDLLTGAKDGGVYWYRNIGKKGSPTFAPPVALIAPHEGIGYGELLDADRPPRPGVRSQIAVSDYDQDGKLDLLVGDFCTYLQIKPDLSDEQRKDLNRIIAQRDEAVTATRAAMDRLRADFSEAMRGAPRSDWESDENQAKWQEMYREMRESTAYQQVHAKYERTQIALKAFVEHRESSGDDADVPHGYVWYYRRR
jgi:hypothetical protein